MPEWLIIMVAIWAAVGLSGRGGCGGRRHARWRERWQSASGDDVPADPRARRQALRRTQARRVAAPTPPESVEARLRREFVDGRLSMEEYEAALWREIGPR